jgi:hypothetical protein
MQIEYIMLDLTIRIANTKTFVAIPTISTLLCSWRLITSTG